MYRQRRMHVVAIEAVVVVLLAHTVSAQPLGPFRWQLLPYCNLITVNVSAQGTVFTLDGVDDQCGADQRASVVGTAFLNPDGTIGIGLSTVTAPGAAFVHVDARIGLSSLGGPWRDSAGNSGTFVFTPESGSGGPLRPVPSNGIAPGSVTAAQLGAGSVTAAQLATGSVGAQHIDPAQVQRRVAGECPVGQYLRGITADGLALCGTPLAPVSGAIRIHRDYQLVLPDSSTHTVASLSADGTGPLVVPYPARLFVHGAIGVWRWANGISFRCEIIADPIGRISGDMLVYIATQGFTDTLPLAGSADIAPGTYDVRVVCASAAGNSWEDVDLFVVATPR